MCEAITPCHHKHLLTHTHSGRAPDEVVRRLEEVIQGHHAREALVGRVEIGLHLLQVAGEAFQDGNEGGEVVCERGGGRLHLCRAQVGQLLADGACDCRHALAVTQQLLHKGVGSALWIKEGGRAHRNYTRGTFISDTFIRVSPPPSSKAPRRPTYGAAAGAHAGPHAARVGEEGRGEAQIL